MQSFFSSIPLISRVSFVVVLGGILPSCTWLNTAPGELPKEKVEESNVKNKSLSEDAKKKSVEKAKRSLRLVGRVYSINENEKFAVVQGYGKLPDLESSVMVSRARDRSEVNLKPTGEQIGQFFTADVRNGFPKVGDAVFYRSTNLEAKSKL